MKKESNFLFKMWQEKRGKAIIKLIIWSLFIIIVGISLITSKPQIKQKEETKTPGNQTNQEQPKNLKIEEQFQILISQNYQYEYKIITLENNENLIYKGEKEQNIETGYKESKIGIIKYKIENGKTYQILIENEEEIASIWDPIDEEIISLKTIFEKIKTSEKIEETENVHIYYHNKETITIKSDKNKISTIKIITTNKIYELKYSYEEQ